MSNRLFSEPDQLLPEHIIQYHENFFSSQEAQLFHTLLMPEISWHSEQISMFGKKITVPRLVAWYGEPQAVYTYSGVSHQPLPWTETLLMIKARVEQFLATEFNSVLANLYRNGNDSMGWHADNEPELGDHPVIASLSFGASRKFRLCSRDKKEMHEIFLEPGSLLVMQGSCQRDWRHEVPKMKNKNEPRINLTFRNIIRQA